MGSEMCIRDRPYPIGLVELEEGVRIIANLINVAPDDVKVGMKLRVAWESLSDDINYFSFEPDRRRR